MVTVAYRRRRTYRARARRRHCWVRGVYQCNQQIGPNSAWRCDLLAALKPSAAEAPFAIAGGVPSVVGSTVVRTRLKVVVNWQLADTGLENYQLLDAVAVGLSNSNWTLDSAPSEVVQTATSPREWFPHTGSNAGDWALYDWFHWAETSAGDQTLASTVESKDTVKEYDVRSKRKLEDFGDTWVFTAQYGGTGAGPHDVVVCASTLIALPSQCQAPPGGCGGGGGLTAPFRYSRLCAGRAQTDRRDVMWWLLAGTILGSFCTLLGATLSLLLSLSICSAMRGRSVPRSRRI